MSAHHRDDYETDEDFREAVLNDAAISFHARRYREEGTGADLLAAAAAALRESPLPPDLLADFVRAVWRYKSADAWTLDEAFGVSRPKGKHQQPEKERLSNLDFRLRQEVDRLYDDGVPIDEAIRQAGAMLGLGKTKAGNIYYAHRAAYHPWVLRAIKFVSIEKFTLPVKNKKKREDP